MILCPIPTLLLNSQYNGLFIPCFRKWILTVPSSIFVDRVEWIIQPGLLVKKVGTGSCGGGFCLCNHLHSYKVLEKRCQMGHVFILLRLQFNSRCFWIKWEINVSFSEIMWSWIISSHLDCFDARFTCLHRFCYVHFTCKICSYVFIKHWPFFLLFPGDVCRF